MYITVERMTAGVASGIVASYNSASTAQGIITGNVPATFSLNTDCTLAIGDLLTYKVRKALTGHLVGVGTFTVGLEEI